LISVENYFFSIDNFSKKSRN